MPILQMGHLFVIRISLWVLLYVHIQMLEG